MLMTFSFFSALFVIFVHVLPFGQFFFDFIHGLTIDCLNLACNHVNLISVSLFEVSTLIDSNKPRLFVERLVDVLLVMVCWVTLN